MVSTLITKPQSMMHEHQFAIASRRSVRAWSNCRGLVVEPADASWRLDPPKASPLEHASATATDLLLSALVVSATKLMETLAPELGIPTYAVRGRASCGAEGPDFQDVCLEIEVESSASAAEVGRLVRRWKEQSYIYLALSRLEIVEKITVLDPYSHP